MHKAVHLDEGRKVDLYWDKIDGKLALTEIVLEKGTMTLGVLTLDERGGYTSPCYVDWFANDQDEKAAADYYAAKHPDLAGDDRQALFERGFAREVELGPIIGKAEELAAALDQEGSDGFFAIDDSGRIIGYGEDADEAFEDAERKGWSGWFSPDRTDEDTAMLVPMNKVRVREK